MEERRTEPKTDKFIKLWLSMNATERMDSATFLVESYGHAIINAMHNIARKIDERRISK